MEIVIFVLTACLVACLFVIWKFSHDRSKGVEQLNQQHLDAMASIKARAVEAATEIRSDATYALEEARRQSGELIEQAQKRRDQIERSLDSERAELRELRTSHERREARLSQREDRLSTDLEVHNAAVLRLAQDLKSLEGEQQRIADANEDLNAERARVAGLSREQAKVEVLSAAEHELKLHVASMAREIESNAKRDADKIARMIITGAIQRVASEQTSESVVSAVALPSDDMKGRIIGREGRNIRVFEQITGVNVLIDDTPESVLLSSFDPVRRECARMTLADLVEDGRIHPARIEEVHAKSEQRIVARMRRAGEDALAEVGISDLHPELIGYVGALTFRTSYGQNVLKHLIECAHLAGVMAAELGLDVATCKRAAFLHDIGKALTHEVEGSHAIVGAELARKYGEHPDIVHAIEAHHNEVEPTTVEALLTQAADAISGSRPGARRESLEAYVDRLQNLEKIAKDHNGVDKVYAMQAGRDVRVMVKPDFVDDIAAQALARDIAREYENLLTYPGQIKVTVIRESRASETAH